MIDIKVPGDGEYLLEHLVLDVNGTIACDGRILEGVEERLRALGERVCVHLITSDTHGLQTEIDKLLGMKAHRVEANGQAKEKLEYIRRLGAPSVVAIGNGAIDSLMIGEAALGILVIGREGAAIEALMQARVVVNDINDALDLLLYPLRVAATLRK